MSFSAILLTVFKQKVKQCKKINCAKNAPKDPYTASCCESRRDFQCLLDDVKE